MRVTLRAMHCYAKTESGEDEIYCVVTTGGGTERTELGRSDVGKFEIGRDIRSDKLLWEGTLVGELIVTVMESDADEPGHGADDFIGEITVSADGNCKPGRATLDEGYDESKQFRQFSMTGSGAHYVVQVAVATI